MDAHRNTLTSRDVLTQVFEAKARKGYEPREVDAFLRRVADALDVLQDEVETLKLQVATAIPMGITADAPVTAAPASGSRAEHESLEMILRLAQKTAEETLSEAHRRADEVVAEANFRAAQIGREADRKAFEAASRTQSELRLVESDIEQRREELTAVHSALQSEQGRIRDIAAQLLHLSADLTWDDDSDDFVDLTAALPEAGSTEAPASDVTRIDFDSVAAAPSVSENGTFENIS